VPKGVNVLGIEQNRHVFQKIIFSLIKSIGKFSLQKKEEKGG
jgi:hypothetical protein